MSARSSRKRKRAIEEPTQASLEEVDSFPIKHFFHLADRSNLPSIREHGLLSTEQLVEKMGVPVAERVTILANHRPKSITLRDGVTIRDQGPQPPNALRKVLPPDCSPSDWYQLLNGFVFLWPTRERAERHRNACGSAPQALIVLDACKLLADLGSRVSFSPINSGFAMRKAAKRSPRTFVPYHQWRETRWSSDDANPTRASSAPIVEVTVKDQLSLEPYLVGIE